MSPESERLITDLIGAYLGPAGSGERHDATHALRAHIEELERDREELLWLYRNNGRLGNPMRNQIKMTAVDPLGNARDVDDLRTYVAGAMRAEKEGGHG